ncbi:uncharacterized protein PgNI_01899 [Pyricularia grisea]|uniref:Uncharacterized protein n=1 Tax=Pyricularia grisea TaxID=148305 RepID=A0A6P8BKI8_PYRGI|nr:uncharacterized protein PgNI_01899 [Pyricularia grisea]TLD17097.1 hypothetical protein PgNI_01899 [Pyricularia grisea]
MNAYRQQEQQQQRVPMCNHRTNKLQQNNSKFQRLVEHELRYGYLDRPIPSQGVTVTTGAHSQGPLGVESSVRGKKRDVEVSVCQDSPAQTHEAKSQEKTASQYGGQTQSYPV